MSLLIGIAGRTLAAHERVWLKRPEVAGVIVFARNLGPRAEVTALVRSIRKLRADLILAVDQEGGPVQRLRDGFLNLPPLQSIGALHARNPSAGLRAAGWHATLMASEVLAVGIDLSLAPVLDLARGNRAIGVRAFSAEHMVCASLGARYVGAMQRAGMAATLKHFPGHGSVLADTHHEVAEDPRPLQQLMAQDVLPFAAGIAAGARAVMLAHVRYPALASVAAGFAPEVMTLLRAGLGFGGIVMSDDVSMVAAHKAGSVPKRVEAHYRAGCDLVLVCQPTEVDAALGAAGVPCIAPKRLARLRMRRREQAQAWVRSRAFRERAASLNLALEQA